MNSKIIECLNFIEDWCASRKLVINHSKTNILYLFKKNHPIIHHRNHTIHSSSSIKILGLTFSNHRFKNKLNFSQHINNIIDKIQNLFRIFFALISNTWGISFKKRLNLFKGMVRPAITYACDIWFEHINLKQKNKLDSLQHRFLIKTTHAYCTTPKNIVAVICNICHLSDYCLLLNSTKNIDDLSIRKYVRSDIASKLITGYYTNTNCTFKMFFDSSNIPKVFQPNFFNMQFVSGHGNFNYYLHRFNLFHTSSCDCGFHEQDSIHVLLTCPLFSSIRIHSFSNLSEFFSSKFNFHIFNSFCKNYYHLKCISSQ